MDHNTLLLLYAALSVAGLVLLIAYFKISAFIALIIASIFVGLFCRLEPIKILKAFQDGVGAVLGSIAIIIALGTILGKIFAESGGAEVIASKLIDIFGPARLPWAFLFICLFAGLTVFFAVGLVLLVPILYTTAQKHNLPLLSLGLPMIAGLSAAHGFVPPHPGPLAAIELLKADMGKTILYSLPIALVTGIFAGPLFARMIRLPGAQIPAELIASQKQPVSFPLALFVIGLPIILMSVNTVLDVLRLPDDFALLKKFANLMGHPIMALLVGLIFAAVTLGRRFSKKELLDFSEESLGPIAVILLVVGAGGGFSRVLIESGVGNAIKELAVDWSLPALPMGFVLAAAMRIATGSATVAITTSAAMVKPIADAQPGTNLELLVLAMGAGSLILSHVNDGGFWLAKSYLNLSVTDTFKTWTLLETILSLAGFGCVLVLNSLL